MKWKQCCTTILPKCQSVAHLLHHCKYVVSHLLDLLYNPPPSGPSLALRIIGVLSRDLQGEMHPFFGDFMESFISLLQKDDVTVTPELASSVFRCMGYLFKYNARYIRSDMSALKGYYARLLGHKKTYIRRYSSEVFALLLRGADIKSLGQHLRFILRRVGRVNANMDTPLKEKEGLVDGLVNLFFFLTKGVKGRMHSKGSAVLRLVLRFLIRNSVTTNKERETNVLVAKGMIQHLCFHLRSPYSIDFWLEMARVPLMCIEKLRKIVIMDTHDDPTSLSQANVDISSYVLGLSHQLMLVRQAILHGKGILLRDHSVALKMAPIFYHLLSSCTEVLFLLFWKSEVEENLSRALEMVWIEASRAVMSCTVVFHSSHLQLSATKRYPSLLSGLI